MELSTILELVKAGFTKDEIMQMAQPQTAIPDAEPEQIEMDLPVPSAEPEPVQRQGTEPVPVPQPAPQPVPQPVQTPQPEQPSIADVMQGIAKLTSAIQANAIANSMIPNSAINPPKAEDIMAEIIRPTYRGNVND